MSDNVQEVILKTIEASLEAQLRAVRRLRKGSIEDVTASRKSRSQLSVVYDVLNKSGVPLHVSEIIERAKVDFDCTIDRESIVSSLSKKVVKKDTFRRTDKNTFELI